MSFNSNTFRTNNERQMLLNILNTMYNDNLRHITSVTDTLNSLLETNNQIRNSITQLLQTNQMQQRPMQTSNTRRNSHQRRNNVDRFMINNQPYIIDSISEFSVPQNEQFTQLLNSFLQPVEIYPTQTQIETATRRVLYRDIARPINTSCPISMDDFVDTDMVTVIRHCGHTFYTEPLMNWFQTNCRCPVCRYDIRDYNTGTTRDIYNTINTTNNNANNNNNSIFNDNPISRTTSISSSASDLERINSILYDIESVDASGNILSNSIITLLYDALNRNRSM
jgi:hypothetical protein